MFSFDTTLQALGYLGGIHLAVLAAFICRRHPNAPLSVLVSDFFHTYATWRREADPVILEDDNMSPMSRMCIQYCDSNITKSTFDIIKTEFRRAHDFLVRDFDWRPLFEVVSYAKNYESFLKISVSSRHKNELGDWVGWVKSRMPRLLFKLEKLPGFCHPNPTTYGGSDLSKVFYWGLDTNKSNIINVESIQEDFMRILMGRHEGPIGTMELRVVNASEFPEVKTNKWSTIATKTRRAINIVNAIKEISIQNAVIGIVEGIIWVTLARRLDFIIAPDHAESLAANEAIREN
ncbi:hypothetical protein BUALT_Bualt05G0010000 [Buddleja alternifolia]|uniref:polynucleotide adenylyltransferase n=1 Tax=Buddleja alternifolia TaxID=168488 RepID=A0AAV6XMK2_9LAMI|nr:hypothetical protein BUALT_Bualt05G0010000 [Buddleja alternifolia]